MTDAIPSRPPLRPDEGWRPPSRDFFGGPPPVDPADPTNVPSEPMGEVPPEVVFTAGGAIAAPSQARRYASGGFLPAGDLSKAPEWLRESQGCVIPLGRLTAPERRMLEVALEKIGTPPGAAHQVAVEAEARAISHNAIVVLDAVERLEALTGGAPEEEHSEADGILLEFVPDEVKAAYLAARERVGFWYA